MAQHKTSLIALILFLLAVVLRVVIVVHHNFDGLYGQDAFAYYGFADVLHHLPEPLPPFFWSLGYPLQLAISFALFGVSAHVALGLNILMGALLAVLVYILALQLRLKWLFALIAGLSMALSGQALQSSLVIMSDIPALFWLTLSMVALLRYLDIEQRRWLMLFALSLSIACLARWIYLMFVPVSVIILYGRRRILWRDGLLMLSVALIPVIPQLLYNHSHAPTFLTHSWLSEWSPLNWFAQQFVNIEGAFHYEQINALFYAAPMVDTSYFSPILLPFFIVGILAALRSRQWRYILLLLSWLLLPYVFLAGVPYQNIRYILPIVPAVVLFTAWGLQTSIELMPRAKWLLILVGVGGLLHLGYHGIHYADDFVELHQSEKAVVEWLAGRVPDDATLYTFGTTLTLQHYTDFDVLEIFYETPESLAERWVAGQADFLLINVWQIDNQWQEREPQIVYHWLYANRGLREIGRFRYLTLFEVAP